MDSQEEGELQRLDRKKRFILVEFWNVWSFEFNSELASVWDSWMKAGAVIVAMLAGMKRFMCAPGAKPQLPQLWHPILAGQWQSTKISRI